MIARTLKITPVVYVAADVLIGIVVGVYYGGRLQILS
jgi:hypothetical protein